MLFTVHYYINAKFEWRENYILRSESSDRFLLSPYIENYPTYEEYAFSWFFDKPRYIDFHDECFLPALNDRDVNPDCKSTGLIERNYRIDVRDMIDTYYGKMRRTAQQIKSGSLNTREKLSKCLNERRCVPIALLPDNAQNINRDSLDHFQIRQQFWSLINDRQISKENCDFMDLCRAMTNIDVITIENSGS